MEIPRFRLVAQRLHALESGAVNPKTVVEKGWAHALSEATVKRLGRSYAQIIDDHNTYRQKKLHEESTDAIEEQGILVVGLLQSVSSE